MIAAIVAVDNNWGIGYKNQLLCRIPEDLQRFKQLTNNNIVIMGNNTFKSLNKKPLKDRLNIVITSKTNGIISNKNNVYFMDMDTAKRYLRAIKQSKLGDIFIIGGESIYKQLLQYCDKIYLTQILDNFKADTYFPNLDDNSSWKKVEESQINEYREYQYKYITYKNNCN